VSAVDDAIAGIKRRPWLLALPVGVAIYWFWSRQEPGVEEPATDDEGLDGDQFTGREPGPEGEGLPAPEGGAVTPNRPTTNGQWETLAIEYLIGRGYTPAYAQTAITKALTGEPLSVAEKAAVGLAIFALGNPPEGMPPLGAEPGPSAPPTTPPGTTTPSPAPGKPGALRAVAVGRTAVTLQWGPATGAIRYRLFRSGGNATATTTLVAGTRRVVSGLSPGKTYYFGVKGVNSKSVDGPASNTVKVNTKR
jgi:hypothetical protein